MTATAVRVLVLSVAVLVAGCGGGGASADEYREEATEICTEAAADVSAVPPPGDDAASVARYSDAVGAIRERETVALNELEPPDELEAQHTKLINASGAVVRSLQDLARAAERGDRTAAAAAAESGARAADQARRAAEDLGLPACGQPGQAAS